MNIKQSLLRKKPVDVHSRIIDEVNSLIEKHNNTSNHDEELDPKIQFINNEKYYQLLKILHLEGKGDTSADIIANKMDISTDELESLVHELVESGLMKFNSDYEAIITDRGLKYISSNDFFVEDEKINEIDKLKFEQEKDQPKKRELKELKKELKIIQSKLENKSQENSRIRTELEKKQEEITLLNTDLKTKNKKIDEIQKQQTENQTLLLEKNKIIERLNNEVKQKQKEDLRKKRSKKSKDHEKLRKLELKKKKKEAELEAKELKLKTAIEEKKKKLEIQWARKEEEYHKKNSDSPDESNHFHSEKSELGGQGIPEDVIKTLCITDDLLVRLPDEIIDEFIQSGDFEIYKKVIDKYKNK